MSDAVLAVDVGGTHLRAAIVDADGSVHERRSQPTPQDTSCPDALLALTAEVRASGRVSHAVIGLQRDREAEVVSDGGRNCPVTFWS